MCAVLAARLIDGGLYSDHWTCMNRNEMCVCVLFALTSNLRWGMKLTNNQTIFSTFVCVCLCMCDNQMDVNNKSHWTHKINGIPNWDGNSANEYVRYKKWRFKSNVRFLFDFQEIPTLNHNTQHTTQTKCVTFRFFLYFVHFFFT